MGGLASRALLVALSGGPLTGGCSEFSVFSCSDDSDCNRTGVAGQCLGDGCAYPDEMCPSGLRFSETSKAGVASNCVPEVASSGGSDSSSGGGGEASGETGTSPLLPLSRWQLDETEGVLAHDAGGNSNGTYDGVLLGEPPLVTGVAGTAVSLDGMTSSMIAPHVPAFEIPSYTVLLYVKLSDPPPPESSFVLLEKDIGGPSTPGGLSIEVHEDGGILTLAAYTRLSTGDAQWLTVDANAAEVAVNVAYSIALTVGTEGTRLYLDAVGVASSNNTVGFDANQQGLSIGSWSTGPTAITHGWIDEVRLYDRALNPEEIGQLPASLQG